MASIQELHRNYQTCCPTSKSIFGYTKKNKSQYCQKLDNAFRQKQIEENNSNDENYGDNEDQMRNDNQPAQPSRRKFLGIFGGKRTRRRNRKSRK
jgi:hypothetical protein